VIEVVRGDAANEVRDGLFPFHLTVQVVRRQGRNGFAQPAVLVHELPHVVFPDRKSVV